MSSANRSRRIETRCEGVADGPPLATLVYRSRAVKPLAAPDLQSLLATSQTRNRRENVTGLVLYDNERFFQWLEGPAENVGRVMESIRGDARHTDLEVLTQGEARARRFGDWAMKLAAPGVIDPSTEPDVIEPPSEILARLRERPSAAPSVLVRLVPAAGMRATAEEVSAPELKGRMQAVLKSVLLSDILPRLVLLHGDCGRGMPHERTRELAELLVARDSDAAGQLIRELRGGRVLSPLCATLLEPAARQLGDFWREDECSELDVAIGLCRLQTAVRLLNAGELPAASEFSDHPVVLVAPEPGELHQLGAALDTDVLWQAGWTPHREFPADDRALQDLLSGSWFDVLDLSLSVALRHEDLLPRLRATIAGAREASCNPRLTVVVGGRIFREDREAAAQVGADLGTLTATGVDRFILARLVKSGRNVPDRAILTS